MAQKRKRSKKWIYGAIVLVLLVIAGVVVYLIWDNYFRDKEKDNVDKQEMEQVVEEGNNKDQKVEGVDEGLVEEEKVRQYEGEDPNKAEQLTGAITYTEMADNKLMIGVNIDQFLSEGTCNLSLSRGDVNIYNVEVGIVNMVSTATCDGFDVPIEEIGSGDITITIYLKSGERSGKINGEVKL